MRAYLLSVLLLGVVAFALGATLEPRFESWAGDKRPDNLLQVALGDGRKLFAKHFYSKADVYLHSGYYPTIYDSAEDFKKICLAEDIHGDEEESREDFLGKPADWIDRFSRHFFPSRHTHLGDSGCGHSCCKRPHEDSGTQAESGDAHAGHDHDCDHHHEDAQGTAPSGAEREILPWLRLSAQLDPQRPETYVVASFWLRSKLGKVDEAEQFLREGLQANPGDCEILLELGRIYYENRNDVTRARNVWELSLKQWREREQGRKEPSTLVGAAILNCLAMLEREHNNYPRAIEHYSALKEISPSPESIQAWIDYLKTNGPPIRVGLRRP